MTSVIAWVRMLGNAGAVANARALAEKRAVEDWAVAAVACRLDERNAVSVVSDQPASAA